MILNVQLEDDPRRDLYERHHEGHEGRGLRTETSHLRGRPRVFAQGLRYAFVNL
jgi:hypothetical protein